MTDKGRGHTIDVGRCQMDPVARVLRGQAGTRRLSPLGTRFLVTLAERPGAIVSREVLIDRLWSGNYLVGAPALNRLASEVRRAIVGAAGEAPMLETVRA